MRRSTRAQTPPALETSGGDPTQGLAALDPLGLTADPESVVGSLTSADVETALRMQPCAADGSPNLLAFLEDLWRAPRADSTRALASFAQVPDNAAALSSVLVYRWAQFQDGTIATMVAEGAFRGLLGKAVERTVSKGAAQLGRHRRLAHGIATIWGADWFPRLQHALPEDQTIRPEWYSRPLLEAILATAQAGSALETAVEQWRAQWAARTERLVEGGPSEGANMPVALGRLLAQDVRGSQTLSLSPTRRLRTASVGRASTASAALHRDVLRLRRNARVPRSRSPKRRSREGRGGSAPAATVHASPLQAEAEDAAALDVDRSAVETREREGARREGAEGRAPPTWREAGACYGPLAAAVLEAAAARWDECLEAMTQAERTHGHAWCAPCSGPMADVCGLMEALEHTRRLLWGGPHACLP